MVSDERKVIIDNNETRIKLDRLYSVWEKNYENESSDFYKIDSFVIISGKSIDISNSENKNNNSSDENNSNEQNFEENEKNAKSEYFQIWLTGFQFPETLFVFCRDGATFFLSSIKKLGHLEQIRNCREGIKFLTRNSESNTENFMTIINHISSFYPNLTPLSNLSDLSPTSPVCTHVKVGILSGNSEGGNFASECKMVFKNFKMKNFDSAIGCVMSVKSSLELDFCKKAGHVGCAIMKNLLISRIESVLDNEEKESHENIAKCAARIHTDKKIMEKLRDKFKIEANEVELIYSNVQSGESFDLRASADATQNNLSLDEGCILVSVGCKYKDFAVNLARTLILNGKDDEKEMYSFSLDVFKVILQNLKPGNSCSQVYAAARNYINENKSEVLDKFVKNVGHSIGIEFRDSNFVLNLKNTNSIIENGMTFNIYVGFKNLFSTRTKKHYAIWLSDTVAINLKNSEIIVLTDGVSKRLEHMSYELEDEHEEEMNQNEKKEKEKNFNNSASGRVASSIINNADSVILKDRLRRRGANGTGKNDIEERDNRQRELRKKKMEEIRERFRDSNDAGKGHYKKNVRKMEAIKCFEDAGGFPKEFKPNRLYVDSRSESILVPIGGSHIPFHVSTIKNVTCNPEETNKHHTLRINFQVPGSQTLTSKGEDNPLPDINSYKNPLFIKELLYKSEESKQLQAIFRNVKELIKRVKQKQTEADVARDLADQERLQLNKSGRRVILKDLMVRPNIQGGGRKIIGTLEAHSNGLRFTVNTRGGQMDHVDITYVNIKHAVFQPCERELIVLIHFYLKSPIMVGKKKTQDVQFYTEAGSQIDDLDNRKGRSYHDPDETQEEMREREMRKRLNNEFKRFVQQVEEIAHIEFDLPYRELMFTGVPTKSNVEILPTANLLVHLIEWPPFLLSLEEIEIVSFERVQHGLRNFDMIFVFQDYHKPVKRIDLIPIDYLDNLKRWLNELEIVWYEGKNNLQWTNILKHIVSDINNFVENGGFEYFLGDANGNESEDEDDEDNEDDDEEYRESEDSSEGEESDEDSDDEEDEESYDEEDDEEDEDEGLSWDELEEQAKKEDCKRKYDYEEEQKPKKKRR